MSLLNLFKRLMSVFAVSAVVFFAFQVQVSGSLPAMTVSTDVPSAEAVVMFCNVTTNLYEVSAGSSVTISWEAYGYSTYTINGEAVSGAVGSKTFTNIQENTTYTFVAKTSDGRSDCTSSVTVFCLPVPPPTCTLTPSTKTISSGDSVNLAWTTTNAASAALSTFGSVSLNGSKNTGPLTANATYTLTVTGTNGSTVSCNSVITVTPIPVPTCTLTPTAKAIMSGESVTLAWSTTNAASATLTNFGAVSLSGSQSTGALTTNKTYTLTVTGINGSTVSCNSVITVTPIPVPTCTLTPTATTIQTGTSVNLAWSTTNAASATLTNFGSVALSGSQNTGAITANKTYLLTVVGNNGNTVTCQSVITVTPLPVPTCTLTPTAKAIMSGESVNLVWSTTNAASATLTNFGSVALSGSQNTGALTTNKTYTLTVTGTNGSTVSCNSVITVQTLPVPTCTLTPTAKAIMSGESVNLVWSTTNAASATLTNFGSVALSGSQNTGALTADKTYVLTVVGNDGSTIHCNSVITVQTIPAPTCVLTPATVTINHGASVNLVWSTTNAASATLTNFGSVALSGSQNTGALTTNKTYLLTVVGNNGNTVTCQSVITVTPIPSPTCTLTPASTTVKSGESVNLTWSTTNATSATLTNFGSVALSGSQSTGAITASKTYVLNVVGNNGSSITCQSVINVENLPPAPSCDAFTANPTTITKGNASQLRWTTTNATRVVIDNGIGEVSATGTLSVSPLATIEYTLKAYGVSGTEVSCKTKITVDEPLIPSCESFVATPSTLPVGGGAVNLSWVTKNGTSASISPTLGTVSLFGSTTVSVATTSTYTLTVLGVNNQSDSCAVTITVTPPTPVPFTCANNVTLSANPVRISRGDSSTLSWTTTGVTAVSFDQGITATGLSGSLTVEPSVTTTYTLKATKGTETISCPVPVTVTTGGGGGGGSSSPTCELSISDNKIKRGQTVTLRWDSSRATEMEIRDSKGKVVVTTKNKLSDAKDDLFDGSERVSPASDTTYTMTVERGSRERTCKVSVDVEDTVVTQVRDQQPLIAGISLTQVPYTGFEAGPFLTLSFYALLMAWALYIAYILVIKRDVIGGYALAQNHIVAEAPTPEQIRSDVFVASVRSPLAAPMTHTPVNLPVGNAVIGYAQSPEAKTLTTSASTSFTITDEVITSLENHAHAKKALLSSDAIRHLVGTTTSIDSSIAALNDVITDAKAKYPSEDGWVVINEKRMRELCDECQIHPTPSSVAPFVPTVIPEGSGSLAEAIVTGNVVAAYEMIGHRPMFALADAAADMDSILRARRGGTEVISDLLRESTKTLSDAQVMSIIEALTGALDGTYTDEASAVKMAIMKAVKVVA